MVESGLGADDLTPISHPVATRDRRVLSRSLATVAIGRDAASLSPGLFNADVKVDRTVGGSVKKANSPGAFCTNLWRATIAKGCPDVEHVAVAVPPDF